MLNKLQAANWMVMDIGGIFSRIDFLHIIFIVVVGSYAEELCVYACESVLSVCFTE